MNNKLDYIVIAGVVIAALAVLTVGFISMAFTN